MRTQNSGCQTFEWTQNGTYSAGQATGLGLKGDSMQRVTLIHMKITKAFWAAFLLTSFFAGSFSVEAKVRFSDSTLQIPLLPEARAFTAEIDGIDIIGADIGPLDGKPVVLVGGITTSFPYMRKFIRALNAKGFRVFVYNPPGQGRGELESGANSEIDQLGIDGMLKVFPAVRNYAFQTSGKKKVVVIGHSLGGLQVRAGSLGIIFDKSGKAKISLQAREQAQNETAMIVPMFSLALFGDEIWETADRLKVMALKDFSNFVIESVAMINFWLPEAVSRFNETLATGYLGVAQGNVHKGLFGANDLDKTELEELGRFILPQKVSSQIREDLNRWWTTKKFTTNSEYDFGAAWQRMQSGSGAIPVLYVAGEHDSLTELGPFAAEAQALHSARMVTVATGHLGAFLSQTLPEALAEVLLRARKVSNGKVCESWILGMNRMLNQMPQTQF